MTRFTPKYLLIYATSCMLILFATRSIAADAGSLIGGKFNANSRNERILIAKDILARVESLDSYLSNPKPSDVSWVREEQEAIDKLKGTNAWDARTRQFHESPEFQHLKLKTLLTNIKTSLKCIVNEKVKLKSEILCWAKVSHKLSDRTPLHDSIMILKRHGRLPKDITEKANIIEIDGYIENYYWYALGIQEYIVIPYLSGQIK